MAAGLPLTFRREDWLELFFERRGHAEAMLCRVVPWIGFQGMHVLGFGDELRILERFQESRLHGSHAIVRYPGGMVYGRAANKPALGLLERLNV